ncbi:MAG: hypothetical protein WDA70_05775 [Lysobacteraceae bacterium]
MDAQVTTVWSRAGAFAIRIAPYVHVLFVGCVVLWFVALTRWQFTPAILAWAAFLILWQGVSLGALARWRWATRAALSLSALALVVPAFHWIGRVGFVIRHGGMDCADCQGSPNVFLWHWLLESAVLFPGLISIFLLYASLRTSSPDIRH